MKIDQSVILITGGASGLGENIAKYFSKLNAIIYICDLNIEGGKKIEQESDNKIKFIYCDVTNEEQVIEMITRIKNESGRLDVLINSEKV